jgi:hypothetical protein
MIESALWGERWGAGAVAFEGWALHEPQEGLLSGGGSLWA